MTPTFNNMTFTKPAAKRRLELMLVSCRNGRTKYELQVIFNIDRRTVGNYISYLRHMKRLHISGWTRENLGGRCYPVPIFKTGAGEDAPKPPKMTPREVRVRAWAKLKSDPERYEAYRLAQRKTPVQERTPTPAVFNWRGKPSIFSKERQQL